jgi:MFS family permease
MSKLTSEKPKVDKEKLISASMAFIILMAFVSMASDMTHEGANSMSGAFESYLGAPAMVISVVGGVASLLGCGLRFLTGWLADKTKHYWTFTIIGYLVDLISVPLLALVPEGGWILAVCFILLEKVGKAVKKPAKDTLVSFAASGNGVGKSFAFGELLDQIGATIGPMILTLTYLIRSDLSTYKKYIVGFAVLGIPAVLCFALLLVAYFKNKHPEAFEKEKTSTISDFYKKPSFILFIVASICLAIGFLDSFALISSHLSDLSSNGSIAVSSAYLPLLYSYAMFIDAIAAVVFGLLFDKIGFASIAIAVLLTAPYAFFIFYINTTWSIFVGLTMWGIGMGASESVMKSGITCLSGKAQRARAFGTYELFYGLATFGGSFLIGWLYDASTLALCLVSCLSIGVACFVYLGSDLSYKKDLKVLQ